MYNRTPGAKKRINGLLKIKVLHNTCSMGIPWPCAMPARNAIAVVSFSCGVVHVHVDEWLFCILSESLVRPILEYGNVILIPILIKDILHLGKVQWRATKLVYTIQEMLWHPISQYLPSLIHRHTRADATVVLRCQHSHANITQVWITAQ